MPAPIYLFEKGLNSVDDPRLLVPGELVSAFGAEYRLGRDTLFSTGARASAGTLGAGEHVLGSPVYAQYDTAASVLIAGVGTGLFEATAATSGMSGTAVKIPATYIITNATNTTPIVVTTGAVAHGATNGDSVTIVGVFGNAAANGTFTVANVTTFTFELATSVGSGAYTSGGQARFLRTLAYTGTPSALIGRMDRERLYLASGVGFTQIVSGVSVTRKQNLIRKSDGTWMPQSMLPAVIAPTVAAAATTASAATCASISGSWITPANAVDSSDETKSTASLSAAGTVVHTWGFNTFTAASHKLKILHKGGGVADGVDLLDVGIGGSTRQALVANLKIEVSLNNGTTYQTLSDKAMPYAKRWLEWAIPNGTYTQSSATALLIRATLTYTSGSATANGLMFTIKAVAGGSATIPEAQTFRYVVTEWDDLNKKESSPSPQSDPVTLNGTTQNSVTVTYDADAAGTLQNNRATHWRVYRQPGGAALDEWDKYGFIAEKLITEDSFLDTFDQPLTEVARPPLQLLITGQGDDRIFYPLNQPVALAFSIDFFKGSMVLLPVDDFNNAYYTPAYDPENRPDLYAIPSRSPRNDHPLAVRTCDNIWVIFFHNWARRVEGIPLVINGLFDAANYADVTTTRGISGPLAVDNITNLEDDGSVWLAVADDIGVYLTNGSIIKPWSENIDWKALLAANQQSKTIVFSNIDELRRRIEIYVVPVGQTSITQRMDAYHGTLRSDGQPKWTGPHPVNARGVVSCYISGALERFTGNGTTGQGGGATAGAVYREDPGTFADASRSYNSSQHVQRLILTGDLPIAGLGEDGFVRQTLLRTRRGAYATITETVTCRNSSGEAFTATNSYDPSAPTPCGVVSDIETVAWQGDDTGTTEKAEILGYRIESQRGGEDDSALRSGFGAVAATTALPT